MLTKEKKNEMLRMARGLLPNGWAIVPLDPTPRMLEQAAFNLSESYGPERVKELGKFARDSYAEMVNAGMSRGQSSSGQSLKPRREDMTKPWITTPRDRQSAKYKALHVQLAKEVGESRSALAKKTAKQSRKFAKSELYAMYGETP